MYSLQGIVGTGHRRGTVVYNQGIAPTFMRLERFHEVHLYVTDVYQNRSMKTRDITGCFHRLQLRIRDWLAMRRALRRLARPRLLLLRELGLRDGVSPQLLRSYHQEASRRGRQPPLPH